LKGVNIDMKFKKILLPLAAGALTLSLAACGDEDKAAKEEAPKQETVAKDTKEESAKAPTEKEAAADAKKMQAKLDEQQVDKSETVAIVNEEELTGDQYNQALMSIQGQMQQMGQDPTSKESAEQIKKQTLDSLVNQTLIRQKAAEAKLTATEEEVNKEYATYEEQFGGEEGMAKALEAQKMDIETLKEQIADSIVFGKYQDKVAPAKEVTDKQIQEYYDQAVTQAKEAKQEIPPLEEAKVEIKGILEQEQQQEIFATHIEKLKADAKIELKI
jgi:hypothetical protein